MKNILVLGIGNLLLQDEGLGIHVIKKLEEENFSDPNVDVIDGGTGGFTLIHELEKYKEIIMIDSTLDNLKPGTIKLRKPKYSKDYPTLLSAHDFGLKNMIDSLIFLERMPNVHLITVSVNRINSLGLNLTNDVQNSIPEIISLIKQIIVNLKYYS